MVTKSHVLEEIRRTATGNGGVPLGRLRFFAETGIKESDWLGKHWARWNDAVWEAGFEPNALQSAYPDEFLLDKLATLTRRLGRFPTRPDLRLNCRSDPSFPDPKTLERFGAKRDLAARLAKYCAAKPEFGDVGVLAAAVAGASQVQPARTQEPEFGYVYLLRAGRHYKIGRSNSVGRRERELAIQLPERATLVHSIKTDDPAGIEQYWHHRFQDKRRNGEWFSLSADDIAAFRRRKVM